MIKEIAYKYSVNNTTIFSSTKPQDISYEIYTKIVASPDRVITQNGIDFTYVVYTQEPKSWYEIDLSEEI